MINSLTKLLKYVCDTGPLFGYDERLFTYLDTYSWKMASAEKLRNSWNIVNSAQMINHGNGKFMK